MIWWMIGLVDIIFAGITAGQRNWCFTEIGPCRKNPLCDITIVFMLINFLVVLIGYKAIHYTDIDVST